MIDDHSIEKATKILCLGPDLEINLLSTYDVISHHVIAVMQWPVCLTKIML